LIQLFWIWGPAVAQMTAIFVLSSQQSLPNLPGGLTDYSGHFIGYALLATLLIRALAGATWRGVTARAGWLAVLGASAYGVTDEIHQVFVPGRSATVEDWVADTLGAVTGVLLVRAAARIRSGTAAGRDV
jgi:VanZ family protein